MIEVWVIAAGLGALVVVRVVELVYSIKRDRLDDQENAVAEQREQATWERSIRAQEAGVAVSQKPILSQKPKSVSKRVTPDSRRISRRVFEAKCLPSNSGCSRSPETLWSPAALRGR